MNESYHPLQSKHIICEPEGGYFHSNKSEPYSLFAARRRLYDAMYSPSVGAATFGAGLFMHAKPLIENCRNCGASPEPVCSYCGTVHDGITYKERNRPPVIRTEEEDGCDFHFISQKGIGIGPVKPLQFYSLVEQI